MVKLDLKRSRKEVIGMRIPTLKDIVSKFKTVMVAQQDHSVQQIMIAPRGTVVKVTIEVLGERFRFDGKRYYKKSLPGHSGPEDK